ncbi:MAG: glycine cleavage system aminomethyltransferase GcvT [candidate division KSB1 bacterium]|nr:glycine cleavage system aminomethyltransferase GcvT [candidate division KSB1 bacterium]
MSLKKTGLYEIHEKMGAKLVDFAGYAMPVQYQGIQQEHRRVRSTVGLFDVSHMGEFFVYGEQAFEFLQKLTVNDVGKLSVYQAHYTAMCYPDGGIVDDLLVYRAPDHYVMVVNASNIEKDWEWAETHLLPQVKLTNKSDELSLLALQGPESEKVLQPLTKLDLSEIKFYWFDYATVAGIDVLVSKTGYTGEPGFELMFPREHSETVWNALMESGKPYDIAPIGLGARDTLRLEMKMCLYGNDIDQTTHPLEAGLGWITKLDKGDFIGRDALRRVKQEGITRKLVAFECKGKAFPRPGYDIIKDGDTVGSVTSGTFSPMLKKGIGMGYVPAEYAKAGTPLSIKIRNNLTDAEIIKPPFYQK